MLHVNSKNNMLNSITYMYMYMYMYINKCMYSVYVHVGSRLKNVIVVHNK